MCVSARLRKERLGAKDAPALKAPAVRVVFDAFLHGPSTLPGSDS